jgi:hypothetical protein
MTLLCSVKVIVDGASSTGPIQRAFHFLGSRIWENNPLLFIIRAWTLGCYLIADTFLPCRDARSSAELGQRGDLPRVSVPNKTSQKWKR